MSCDCVNSPDNPRSSVSTTQPGWRARLRAALRGGAAAVGQHSSTDVPPRRGDAARPGRLRSLASKDVGVRASEQQPRRSDRCRQRWPQRSAGEATVQPESSAAAGLQRCVYDVLSSAQRAVWQRSWASSNVFSW